MLVVKHLRVRSLDLDYNYVSWQVEDTLEDLYDYAFTVQRSESPMGPWDVLGTALQDAFRFIDRAVPRFHTQRVLHYRIGVKNIRTGEEAFSRVIYTHPEEDLIALEARRQAALVLQEFSGRKCWLLPVRTFGTRCSSCWDNTLKKRTRSGCLECYDTGFLGGYLAPIQLFVQIDPETTPQRQYTRAVQVIQPSDTTARCADITSIKDRDILVEGENRRWRVVKAGATEHVRSPVHIEMQLHEIPQGDIEYKYPLVTPEELSSLTFSPVRNYSNPHNSSNLDASFSEEVFALYQRKP